MGFWQFVTSDMGAVVIGPILGALVGGGLVALTVRLAMKGK